MRKHINLIAIMMILTLLMLSFSACAHEEAESDLSEADTEYTIVFGDNLQYDTSLDVNGGDVISISFWYPSDVATICENYVDKYEDIHYNVTIKTKSYSWSEYWTALEEALENGSGPDIFWMSSAYNESLIEYSNPLSKTNFPRSDLKKDFRNYDAHEIDGDIYYLDLGYTSSVVLYNKDMWEEAGLTDSDIPTDWEEFKEIAETLTQKSIVGETTVTGFDFSGETSFVSLLYNLNYQSGQLQFSEDGTKSLYYNDTTIENMEFLKSFITDGISEYSSVANRDALGLGTTAMICDWSWVYLYISAIYPDANIGMFSMPVKDDAPAVQMMYSDVSPCINNSSSEEQIAVGEDFVKFLLSYDNFIKEYSLQNSLYPSKYSLEDNSDIMNNILIATMGESIDKSILTVPASAEIVYSNVYYLQSQYLTAGMSAKEATINADTQCAIFLLDLNYNSIEREYDYIVFFE